MTEPQRRWISTILAIVAIGYGIHGLGKPFWSLESMPILILLAIGFLLFWRGEKSHRMQIAAVVAFVVVGLIFDRDLGVALFVYGAVAYLLIRGVIGALAFRRQHWFTGLAGLAMLLLGVMAANWLDVTSIVVGLLIGPALILTGVVSLWRSWRDSSVRSARRSDYHHPAGIILGRIGSVLLLVIAVAATIATGVAVNKAPSLDGFADYDQPLGNEPGVLLRFEPFDRGMPDRSVTTRILYTTTGIDGHIALATGLVIVPENAPDEPLPVVLWAHGTTGIEPECAPTTLNDPLGAGAMLFPEQPLDQGWAIVAPDYIGMGTTPPHPYLVGTPTAHSSLDSVRAARMLESASLSDQTVVWGHSQGGGAALWIGIEAPTYAPDIPLLGVVAMSPASNLTGFIKTALATEAGPIFGGYIILAYANTYDDIELNDYIRSGARFSQEKLVERCLSEPSIIVSVISALIREPFTRGSLESGPLYDRLEQNIPASPMGVPLFLGQGEADPLIEPSVQADYVQNLCTAGQVVEYHTYVGLDHMGVVSKESPMIPDVMEWTTARFATDPPVTTCTTTEG